MGKIAATMLIHLTNLRERLIAEHDELIRQRDDLNKRIQASANDIAEADAEIQRLKEEIGERAQNHQIVPIEIIYTGSTHDKIIQFLQHHDNKPKHREEIARAIGASVNAVAFSLSSSTEFVNVERGYWKLK